MVGLIPYQQRKELFISVVVSKSLGESLSLFI